MAKVLIVDDSETHLYTLSQIVQSEGHEVITASGGEEGVKSAIDHIPDLILMDVVMPTSNIPIIIVTTKDQETDRIWGMRQGASAYITKPVDRKALVSTMHDLLGA